MGCRGKVAEREQARELRAQVWTLAEIDEPMAAGRERLGTMTDQEFLVAGVALYAGEGAKTQGAVKLANTDPRMILFFYQWLRRPFEIDEGRLRVQLYLHEGLDLEAARHFWSDVANVPHDQFLQPYRAVPDEGIRNNKHEHGCATVIYSCSRTHRTIMGL